VNAAEIAAQCGDLRAVNIVLIGVMAGLGLGGISREIWNRALMETVPKKSLSVNQSAFEKGYERGES
jgi:indolepyruvate ferredoxin oxidoreductase beta subunit